MTVLSDYLEKRRLAREAEEAQRELDESSPEALLEALNANTGHTADLIGDQSKAAESQNKAVLDSLEIVASAVSELDTTSDITYSIDQSAQSASSAYRLTNKTLVEINATLRELAETNRKIEKHLRPALNSKDDTYVKKTPAQLAAEATAGTQPVKPQGPGVGAMLADSLFDLFGSGKDKTGARKTGKTLPKAGRMARFRTALGSIASKGGKLLKYGMPGYGAATAADMAIDAASEAKPGAKPAEAKPVEAKPVEARPAKSKLAEFSERAGKAAGETASKVVSTGKSVLAKPLEYAARAREAVAPTVDSLAQSASKYTTSLRTSAAPVVEKAVEYAERAKAALTPVAQSVKDMGSRSLSYVKEAGTDLIGKFRPAAKTAAIGAVEGAAPATPSLIGRAASAGGRLLSKAAAPLAIGATAYDVYSTETDDSLTRDQKNVKHAGTAGGLAGATLGATQGAALGATIGTVVPVVGNVVGGAVGGLAGGVAGYFGGEKLGETAMSGLQAMGNALPDGIKNGIGAAVALAISPFSKDAEEAVKQNLVPELDRVRAGFEDSTKKLSDNLEEVNKTFSLGVSGFMDKLKDGWEDSKSAVGRVMSSAGSAAGRALQSAGEKVQKMTAGTALEGAGKRVAGGLSSAGESVAMKAGEVGYNLQKGSADSLTLAQGFQGKNSLRGLTEAQTKAYAGDVMKTESGGKLGIENSYGYIGQYQFGADALADQGLVDKEKLAVAKAEAKASGQKWYDAAGGGAHKAFLDKQENWKVEGGKQAFLNDKKLQDDTFVKYTNANIEAGYRSGALGKNSTAEDIAGYAKASHLVGAGAANRLFKDGVDKTDANGTSAAKYAQQGAKAVTELAAKVEATKPATPTVAKTEVAKSEPEAKKPSATPETNVASKPVEKVKDAEKTAVAETKAPAATLAEAKPGDRVSYKTSVGGAPEPVKAPETEVSMRASFEPGAESESGAAPTQVKEVAGKRPAKPKLQPVVASMSSSDLPTRPAGAPQAVGGAQVQTSSLQGATITPELAASLASSPDITNILARPEMVQAMQDPVVTRLAATGDINALSENDTVRNAANSIAANGGGSSLQNVMATLAKTLSGGQSPAGVVPQTFSSLFSNRPSLETVVSQQMPQQPVSDTMPSVFGQVGNAFSRMVSDVPSLPSLTTPMFAASQYTPVAYSEPEQNLATPQPSPAVSMRKVLQPGLSTVSQSLPEEAQPVMVSNAAEMTPRGTQGAPAPGNLFSGFDTAVPKLDNIPLQVSDLGLILLNIGHI